MLFTFAILCGILAVAIFVPWGMSRVARLIGASQDALFLIGAFLVVVGMMFIVAERVGALEDTQKQKVNEARYDLHKMWVEEKKP